MRREHHANLSLVLEGGSLSDETIRRRLENAAVRIVAKRMAASNAGTRREVTFELREYRLPYQTQPPAICETLAKEEGVTRLEWSGTD